MARPLEPIGYWINDIDTVVVHIHACKEALCGRIVWLKEPREQETGAVKLDAKNPREDLRKRPLCGIEVMGGFERDDGDPHSWHRGWIYNPKDGKSYRSRLTMTSPEELVVRGYVLVPLLGKNESWARVEEAPGSPASERLSSNSMGSIGCNHMQNRPIPGSSPVAPTTPAMPDR